MTAQAQAAPSAPAGFGAPAGAGEVTLRWDYPRDFSITKYQYQQKAGGGSFSAWNDIPDSASSGANASSYTVTGLTPGTAYTFKIRAVNTTGNGADSTEASATLVIGGTWSYETVLTPSTIAAGDGVGAQLVFRAIFQADQGSLTSLSARITSSPGIGVSLPGGNENIGIVGPTGTLDDQALFEAGRGVGTPVSGSACTVNVAAGSMVCEAAFDGRVYAKSTATPGQYTVATRIEKAFTYTAVVNGLDSNPNTPNDADFPDTTLTVLAAEPNAPTGFGATPGAAEVMLAWDDPGDDTITKYQYQQKKGSDSFSNWMNIPGSGATTISYTVLNLTPFWAYTFKIRAVNTTGNGAESGEASATPQSQDGTADYGGGNQSLTGPTTVQPGDTVEYVLAGYQSYLNFTVKGGRKTSGGFYTVAEKGSACVNDCIALLSASASPDTSGTPSFSRSGNRRWAVMGGDVDWGLGSKLIVDIPATAPPGGTFEVGFDSPRISGFNWRTDSTQITVTVQGTTPAQPTGFGATAGAGEVTLSWNDPVDDAITKYQYQQKAGSGRFSDWMDIPGSVTTTISYTVTGLDNGVAYTFKLRAVNGAGGGAESGEANATPLIGGTWSFAIELEPDNVAVGGTTGADVTVVATFTADLQNLVSLSAITAGLGDMTAFVPQDSGALVGFGDSLDDALGLTYYVSFEIQPDCVPDLPAGILTCPYKLSNDKLIYAKATATPGRYTISAGPDVNTATITASVNGVTSIMATITGTTIPDVTLTVLAAAPTGFDATAGIGEVALSWTDPADGAITGYQYQQKEGSGSFGGWMDIPDSASDGANASSYTVTGLTPGTAYTFKLRAVYDLGEGAESGEASATLAIGGAWSYETVLTPSTIAAGDGVGARLAFRAKFQADQGSLTSLSARITSRAAIGLDLHGEDENIGWTTYPGPFDDSILFDSSSGVIPPVSGSRCRANEAAGSIVCEADFGDRFYANSTATPGDYTVEIWVYDAFTYTAVVNGLESTRSRPNNADFPDATLRVLPAPPLPNAPAGVRRDCGGGRGDAPLGRPQKLLDHQVPVPAENGQRQLRRVERYRRQRRGPRNQRNLLHGDGPRQRRGLHLQDPRGEFWRRGGRVG